MVSFWFLLILIGCFGISMIIESICWRSDEEGEETLTTPQPIKQEFDAESEVLYVLREMNCIPESFGDDNYVDICFTYQGENFTIRLDEKYRVARILDPRWYTINQADIDNYAVLKDVVNKLNMKLCGTTLFYNTNDENNTVSVSSIDRFLVLNDRKETQRCLEAVLNNFFSAHREFHKEMILGR